MFKVEVRESVDSTNAVIKRAIEEGKPEGLVVRALEQTGGYGRQGRAWLSPKGGMYQSLLLRPAVEARKLPTLALVVALAVRRALAGLVAPACASRIKVKWPNDVVLAGDGEGAGATRGGLPASGAALPAEAPLSAGDGSPAASVAALTPARLRYAKLCGISSEVHAGGVCIGIGVNVAPPSQSAPVGGKNAPAYLSDLGFSCDDGIEAATASVGDAVLRELSPLYARWRAEGFESLAGEFAECSMLAGRFVQMANRAGDVVCEGVVSGVDRDGRLILEDGNGTAVAVSSGEVHLL